jgi:hypothetical protein
MKVKSKIFHILWLQGFHASKIDYRLFQNIIYLLWQRNGLPEMPLKCYPIALPYQIEEPDLKF